MFKLFKQFSDSSNSVSRSALRRLSALLFVALFIVGLHSCRNPGDITINSRTEIERFMTVSQDIREFFDPVIYAKDTFVLDSGSATLRVARVDTIIQRSIRVSEKSDTTTTALGRGRLATASRVDRYSGTFTQRNSAGDTGMTYPYDAEIFREALFQELGTEDDPFLGWELIGLKLGKTQLGISASVTITQYPLTGGFPKVISTASQSFGTGPDGFLYFIGLQSVNAGDSLDIVSNLGPLTVFARTNAGYRQLAGRLATNGANHYGFRTPPADPQNRFFHLLTFQKGPEVVIDSTTYDRFIDTVIVDTTTSPPTVDTVYDSTLAPPDTNIAFEDLWAFPYSVR